MEKSVKTNCDFCNAELFTRTVYCPCCKHIVMPGYKSAIITPNYSYKNVSKLEDYLNNAPYDNQIVCSYCGKKLNRLSNYCGYCGLQLIDKQKENMVNKKKEEKKRNSEQIKLNRRRNTHIPLLVGILVIIFIFILIEWIIQYSDFRFYYTQAILHYFPFLTDGM